MSGILDAVKELETETPELPDFEITSNLKVSLVDGSVVEEKKNSSSTSKKKGRPVVHLFSGRINLLREEVSLALQDGDTFIEQMQSAHKLDEQRRSDLIAAGYIDPNVDQFFYTFQGPISMVLEEMQRVQDKFQSDIDAGTCSIRYDFHKKRIITNEKNPLYVPPATERIGQDIVTKQIEVLPDVIYGYVAVTLNKS